MSDPAAELYQAVIDDHRRRPRNRGPLPSAQRVARRENPACGDVCVMQLRLDPGPATDAPADGARIVAAAFTGAGCALSQASASLATVALTGRDLAEARALVDTVESLVRGDEVPHAALPPGDIVALSAARAYPARHACALLAWHAARDALDAGAASR
jgi:SUF system FeS assembly protein, NifU family